MMDRNNERGQVLVIVALFLVFVAFPVMAWVVDQGFIYTERRRYQKAADSACLNAVIAKMNGNDPWAAATQALLNEGVPVEYFSPIEGSGLSMTRGIWIDHVTARIRIEGTSTSILSHFLGADGWRVAAEVNCYKGMGGFLPLALKEFEEGSKILQTADPNDYWSGACPAHLWVVETLSITPSEREVENCWVWGDEQVLAGDGHVPNEGDVSMAGLIAPDLRCEGPPSPQNNCTKRFYIPPVPEGVASNKVKDLTLSYISAGGYDGPLPIIGNYYGPHSALIAQQDGVSNNFLAQEIGERHSLGDLLVVFVYRSGQLWDGNKNFDYVEVIGYSVVKITYLDANTVAVRPEWPSIAGGEVDAEDLLADDLPVTLEEIQAEGYELYPILLPWEHTGP